MARSSGSIHVADNSVTSINDAIQQLLFMLDELKGEHDTSIITIGPHSHAADGAPGGGESGGEIDHDDLANVTIDQHHDRDHNTRHQSGGLDAIKLDDLAAPEDNTDLNSSTTAHGLLPKLSGSANDALLGDGTFGSIGGKDSDFVDAPETTQIWEQVFSNDGSVTITILANGEAIDLAAGGSGTSESWHPFMY